MKLRLEKITVHSSLQRNDGGIENGGQELLSTLARRIGLNDLSGVNVLDVGCGVRFTQTISRHS